ncbi:MAG: DUF4416 family protein [bacterium]
MTEKNSSGFSLRSPDPVKFVLAVTYREPGLVQEALEPFSHECGKPDCNSPAFVFNHTRYYEKEMGQDLSKQFMSFENLGNREKLVELKLLALSVEQSLTQNQKRRVNLDPAYLELAKLVVASTKNFAHRIYLANGIYGDVQLQYRNGGFIPNSWTYADYRSDLMTEFLTRVRSIYQHQLYERR